MDHQALDLRPTHQPALIRRFGGSARVPLYFLTCRSATSSHAQGMKQLRHRLTNVSPQGDAAALINTRSSAATSTTS